MTLFRRTLLPAIAAMALCCASSLALAQAFPGKQINLIASFHPRGDTDALARVFAEKLATRTGQLCRQ